MRAGKIRKSAKTLYPGEIMADFEEYLKPGKRGHLIGVGGVSMAPLAEVLAGMGLVIDGSDMSESEKTRHLRELGIDVKIGHSAMNVAPDIQFVVRTAAVGDTNPEIVEARARGVPVFERAEAWGAIMRDYENALCIAGTHGKTTTTSMCTHILMAAERDPTVMIGGTLPLLHAGHRVGGGDTIILESCEYHDSFLAFHPTVAVILDVDADHLDYFSGLEDVEKSFRAFAAKVPPRAASSPTSTTATRWRRSSRWAASWSPSASPTGRTSMRATSGAPGPAAPSTSITTGGSSPASRCTCRGCTM